MRIGELSTASGVPVPTIKYYLREGLVPQGEHTGRNQARYDDRHLRRLRLVRALLDVGGLSVAAAADVLATLDSPESGTHKVLGAAQKTVTRTVEFADADARDSAVGDVLSMIDRLGWRVPEGSAAVTAVAGVVGALRQLGQDDLLDRLDDYARAADAAAAVDLELVAARPDIDAMAELVVLGNLLGDALLAALRRMAQASRSTETYSTETFQV